MKIALVALLVILTLAELFAIVQGEPRNLWWARAIAAAVSMISAVAIAVNFP